MRGPGMAGEEMRERERKKRMRKRCNGGAPCSLAIGGTDSAARPHTRPLHGPIHPPHPPARTHATPAHAPRDWLIPTLAPPSDCSTHSPAHTQKMSLSTKTVPHLAWGLAAAAPPETAVAVNAAASADVLGVVSEATLGEPVKGRPKGGGGGGGGEGGAPGGGAAGADEAMADEPKAAAPARRGSCGAMENAEAEAAAAEAAVDAVGDDGALG